MALHELATNAVKYGALSQPGGGLSVSWHLDPTGRTLHVAWREAGGPGIAAPPERHGFGSRVIEQTVRLQLGGDVSRRCLPDGLLCDLTVPLGRDVAVTGRREAAEAEVAA
jgi:two-component sensor histidine kinase